LPAAGDHLDRGMPWIHLSRHRGGDVTTESLIYKRNRGSHRETGNQR
jgi:hypothetical protein